jgi:hypothetical protein
MKPYVMNRQVKAFSVFYLITYFTFNNNDVFFNFCKTIVM